MFIQHETTANTLVVTLTMLALHPEEQERVYSCIRNVVGDREIVSDQHEPRLSSISVCQLGIRRLQGSPTRATLFLRSSEAVSCVGKLTLFEAMNTNGNDF